MFGLSFLIASTLSRSIRKLSTAAQRVKDGSHLNIRTQVTSHDEIGILSDSFNSMIDRIRSSQEEMISMERLAVLGKISGSIAHEIRNPLGVIGSSAYYLKMKLKDMDDKSRSHIDRIIEEVWTSTTIIQSLQDMAKMKEPRKAGMYIANVIECGINASRMPRTVEVVMNVHESEYFVDVDKEQIQMVFKNILNNAVQAMNNKGTIWINADRANNKWVEVSFKDSGPGIAPEVLKKIFQPFFSSKTMGFGFGLTLCKMVVERHGGEIEAQSEVGEGTAFIVRLPSA